MDLHQLFEYGLTGAGFSNSSSHPSSPFSANRLCGSNFDTVDYPSSSFVTVVDNGNLTALSDTQERQSLSDNLSGFSPPSNCTLKTISTPWSSGTSSLGEANCGQKMARYTLQELETALFGTDGDDEVTEPCTYARKNFTSYVPERQSLSWSQEPHNLQVMQPKDHSVMWSRHMDQEIRVEKSRNTMVLSAQDILSGNLKHLLIACARALSENNLDAFGRLIDKARSAVSISGDPLQRLGAYMIEGLVARKNVSGTNIYRALRCREPEGRELLSYMHIMCEICPYLKFGYMAANGAIAEACRNEDRIHIIDFQIAQGTQWITLLQALAARPGGAPHVRITGIDDPVSKYARGAGLEAVGRRLAALSEEFKIPVEFNGFSAFPPEVTREMLDIRHGEAVAVNFPLQLHHIPDESVDVNNPRDGLLRMVKSLSPKVTTLVEQESNTNTTPFLTRFVETLDYYSAVFESIDVALTRDRKERINVEQHCLARDIVNIIACEGKERVERHELLGKWKCRMSMAGFRQYPLSTYVNSVIRRLLRRYSEHYTLEEVNGALLLGWKERHLISASAWQ